MQKGAFIAGLESLDWQSERHTVSFELPQMEIATQFLG